MTTADIVSVKNSSPQRYKQIHTEKFSTFAGAAIARGYRMIPDESMRLRIRRRADGSFDLAVYALIATAA